MIKIVHIAKPIGGVGVYIQQAVKNLSVNEFKNYVLCNTNDDNFELKDANNKEIPITHINIDREINIIKDAKCFNQIIKNLQLIKPDIIHCHSAKAGILGRLAASYLKIPCVYTPHAFSYLSTKNSLKKIVYKTIEKSFKYLPVKTLACSKSEYNRAINDLNFPKNKVLLWKNSLPATKINCDSSYLSNLPEQYICTIGRPSYQKNTELLIETVKKVKKTIDNIHLVVLGVGLFSPLLNKVKKQIKTLNLEKNITLIDWISREKTLGILKKSMFFVSSSRYEGLPYAGIEALLLSKAGVLTNVDGNKDLIDEAKNGFLVKENAEEMARKIIKLYTDKELIKQMSLESKQKFYSEFNLDNNLVKLENIYKNLADEK